MKIQEVIDEVNEAWGEEHEEKRKKIFRENIFWKPLRFFRDISLFCLLVNCISGLSYMSSSANTPKIFPAYTFNVPYYIFDVRAGIIASLASLLLSLYVSVGKFADGYEGILGEARRAAYRKFAKRVSYIISAVFIINFWHAALAGYLQGTSYAPDFFRDLRTGPEWGKYFVPAEIDLSRYGDIPLWVIAFFAWFTLVSGLMLTYNEKDVLIENVYKLKKFNKIYKKINKSHVNEYSIVDSLLAEPKIKTSDFSSIDGNVDSGCEYGDRFISEFSYLGFSFKVKTNLYLKGIVELLRNPGLRFLCIICLFFSPLSVFLVTESFEFTVSVFGVILSVFLIELLIRLFEVGNLYKGLYVAETSDLRWWHRTLIWVRYFWADLVGKLLYRTIYSLFILLVLVYLYASYLESIDKSVKSSLLALMAIFIISIFSAYWVMKLWQYDIKCIFDKELKLYSDKFIPCDIEGSEGGKPLDYLAIAYIYVSVRKINDYYVAYKSEVGEDNLSPVYNRKKLYRYSRSANSRPPKSIRHMWP
jgi:flavodoxin